jgi:hypothetical protein
MLTPRVNAAHSRNSGHKRAQRFDIRTPIRYRVSGESEWRQGTTENMSSSGVLFQCDDSVKPGAALEVIWAVPTVVSGSAAQVHCRGTVVRSIKGAGETDPATLAVTISNYRIIRP